MDILIVESGAKSKTIQKYLGKGWIVAACNGHVRDLPAKDGSVKPEDNFSMVWQVADNSEKQLKEIIKHRMDKLSAIKSSGINPFAYSYSKNINIADIISNPDKYNACLCASAN